MKIGIFKPFFDVKFNSADNSYIFINPEIVKLAKILAKSNEVFIVSPSDLDINDKNPRSGSIYENFDLKILVNGKLYFDCDEGDARVKIERDLVQKFFDNTTPQFHVITDWRIVKKNGTFLDNIDFELITQSPIIPNYGEIEKIFLYRACQIYNHEKDPAIVYIGSQRGNVRNKYLEEYFFNSGINYKLYGRFDNEDIIKNPNFKGKVLFKDSQIILSQNKYALTLTEDLYIEKQHRTPRIWEYFLAGTFPFVDKDYPRDLDIIPPNDFRVISSGVELKEKIDFVNNNHSFYEKTITEQYSLIDLYSNGTYQEKILKNIFDKFQV